MGSEHLQSLLAVLALALVHIVAKYVHWGSTPHPRWLSLMSGVSVAYVFVHLLPELAEAQSHWLERRPNRPLCPGSNTRST